MVDRGPSLISKAEAVSAMTTPIRGAPISP